MNNFQEQDNNLDFGAPDPHPYFSQQIMHQPLDYQPNYGPPHYSMSATNLPLRSNISLVDFQWEARGQDLSIAESMEYPSQIQYLPSHNDQDVDKHHLQRAAFDFIEQRLQNFSISEQKESSPKIWISDPSDSEWEEKDKATIPEQGQQLSQKVAVKRRKLKPLTKSTKIIVIPDPAFQPPEINLDQNNENLVNTSSTSPKDGELDRFNSSSSNELEDDEMERQVIYKHPAMTQFWPKVQKKYKPKKSTNKNKPDQNLLSYAKDELSKKILRHLTSFDRGNIKWPRSVKGNKSKQFDYIKKYFKKEHGIQPEMFDRILMREEPYIITLFCSISTRNSKQIEVAKKLESEPSVVEKSRPGRRKASDANLKLFSKTDYKQKVKTLDRCNLLTGSKQSVIKFFKTQLGRLVYFEPFCTLWEEFVFSRMGNTTEQATNFRQYLQDIKTEVQGDE